MKNITALVPMKGHSERVPFKNIRDFAGKPLLYWILKTLSDCHTIKDIFVDTDSDAIRETIHQYFGDSIAIIDRPASLCGDFVSMNSIIEYDMSVIKNDHFLQTHSTNPLLKAFLLEQATAKYFTVIDDGYDSLFSVTRYQSRFYRADGTPVNHNPKNLIRTQDLAPVYEENSNFYLFSRDSFLSAASRIGSRPYLFEVPKTDSLDIDDECDFKLAEAIFRIDNPQAAL